ncbi:hypothetical protein C8Q75DRAFT_809476 [Abortiporus biennis]|nr:hypothetical protein C8Q75DRAFT_809476 [Abortiporus biennis]
MPDQLQPPVPFDDFTFAFDPALHNLFPSPPPLPSSADLFSPSETNNLLGFLDNFSWDVETEVQNGADNSPAASNLPQDGPVPSLPASQHLVSHLLQHDGKQSLHDLVLASQRNAARNNIPPPTEPSSSSSSPTPSLPTPGASSAALAAAKQKPLLSTPQKRLNHIMSEQKRRNAIRDGYMQLTSLLAPAGAPPGAGMPTRGRPKGSGSRGGRGKEGVVAFKGKSGILFRAVEYIKWLEEGRDALLGEVMKTEAAAGIRH